MKEPIISYDWENSIWHLMVEDNNLSYTIEASCKIILGKYDIIFVDWNPKIKPLVFSIPYTPILLKHVNREDIRFGFDYVCKKCLQLEKVNIEEFKVWLIVQKLKNL